MATIQSAQSGDWHVGSTWVGGSVPQASDRVIINTGHVVQIDADTEIGDYPGDANTPVVSIYGTLSWKISPGSNWIFKIKGNVFIYNQGKFIIGSQSDPIPPTQIARVQIATTSVVYMIKLDSSTTNDAIKPRLIVYGAENYHMASGQFRARLAAVANQGTTQITVDRDVNWEPGDAIAIGSGGDKDFNILSGSGRLSGYGDERVEIAERINARTYTLTTGLAFNHRPGDIVGHLTRNVIFEGTPGYGFVIYKSIPYTGGNYVTTYHGFIDINWAQFIYAACNSSTYSYSVVFISSGSIADSFLTSQHYRFIGVTCDRGYSHPSLNGRFLSFSYIASAHMSGLPCIDKFVSFGLSGFLYMNNYNDVCCGDLVFINQGKNCLEIGGQFYASSVWASVSYDSSDGYFLTSSSRLNIRFGELILCNGYNGIAISGGTTETDAFSALQIDKGEILNCRKPLNVSDTRLVILRNCKIAFWTILGLLYPQLLIAEDCDFYGTFHNSGPFRFDGRQFYRNCTFGVYRPFNYGLEVESATTAQLSFIDCTFKIPTSFSTYESRLGPWLSVPLQVSGEGYGKWYKDNFHSHAYIEFVRLKVLDQNNIDQIAVNFPGITDFAFTGAGTQIRNETTELIDGSFALKMTNCNSFLPAIGTFMRPYQIPIKAGQTLTVKISFKATTVNSFIFRRPHAGLFGCGINEVAYMPQVANTWQQVTVSGTTVCDGLVNFWVSSGCCPYGYTSNPWMYTVYIDGLIVEITGP